MTIFVRLLGGLGNQMFQYAAARALAARHGTGVVWDGRAFRHYRLRPLLIDRLRVTGRAALPAEAARLAPWRREMARLAHRAGLRTRWHFERSLAHDPGFDDLPDGTALDGYFQSARYFAALRDRLRAEFAPRAAAAPHNAALLAALRGGPFASLHVRRGDYAAQAATMRVHGLCSPGYYRAALARLHAAVPGARIAVFSDDIPWCRGALDLPAGTIFVEGNADAPEWDIALMAACRHHIIANSSFSWWGAWLGGPGGLTIAPDPWFDDPALAGQGIVPEDWLRLPKSA
ncbi:MAG: alpha-1,2-fucosyltransferase [Gemmobacter sp.]